MWSYVDLLYLILNHLLILTRLHRRGLFAELVQVYFFVPTGDGLLPGTDDIGIRRPSTIEIFAIICVITVVLESIVLGQDVSPMLGLKRELKIKKILY